MSQAEYDKVVSTFSSLGISFEAIEHEPARTSAEAAAARGGQVENGVKSLLVKVKRKEREFFTILNLPADKKLDWKKAKAVLQADDVRFASQDEVISQTGCEPGGVPPFGLANDLAILVDNKVLERETSEFNAGLKTKSVRLATADLKKAFDSVGVAYFDLSE
jgi:Ala-tRNA(Pro) deacylase